MQLTKEQRQQFLNALRGAFSLQDFDMMLSLGLNIRREDIALGTSLKFIDFLVIEKAEMEGWVDKLLRAAREYNPGNANLLAFSEQFGLASTARASSQQFGLIPTAEPWRNFEKVVKPQLGLLDITKWREQLGQIEGQVCRIEIPTGGKMIYGTGFLLGPDVVITNYHVMEAVIDGINGTKITPDKVVLRFDYKRLSDGAVLNKGVEYQLADSGRIDLVTR